MDAEITFKLEKSTKNTCRYEEQPPSGQPPVIGTLYVQKWWLGDPTPDKLTISIKK